MLKTLKKKTARQIASYGSKMKNKSGQLKIQQMAFMLIALVLFFALVGMFFLTIQFQKIKDSAGILEEKNALLLVTKLANSPEFSCGNSFGTGKINCVDADKAMALRNNAEKYEDFWGVNNIEIRKIYPSNEGKECNSGTYPNCDVIKIEKGIITSEFSNFVSLCRKESDRSRSYDKCEIAKLTVSYDG